MKCAPVRRELQQWVLYTVPAVETRLGPEPDARKPHGGQDARDATSACSFRGTPTVRPGCRSRRRVTVADRREEAELRELREQIRLVEDEVIALRRKLADAPKRVRALEE